MRIGIPKELHPGEKRVSVTPEIIEKIRKLGFTVSFESGAGEKSDISDADFQHAGGEVVRGAGPLWSIADIILKVRAPEASEVEMMKPGQTLISFVWPAQNVELMSKLAAKKVNVLAMDCVPRISRAQKLDALSSMANIAGYRAVIEAAHHFGRFFTGQITAAGKVPPAKVLVIGAGVAGLAAIGAAGSLGAVVRAFDTRPEVKEQVESMGAEFLMLDFKEEGSGAGGYAKVMSPEFIKAEMELFALQAREVDIIITTALIPGKPAPKLITADMVKSMKAGSVIVDMAAEQGGNCEGTEPGRVAVKNSVTLIGYTDLPSRLAKQSSQLYGSNLWRLLEELSPAKNGNIELNMEDEVLRGTTVIKDGQIIWPAPPSKISAAPAPKAPAAVPAVKSSAGGHGMPARAPHVRACDDDHAGFVGSGTVLFGSIRARAVHGSAHGFHARGIYRLYGGVERESVLAHSVDERNECDQRYHRGGRDSASFLAKHGGANSGRVGDFTIDHQYRGRVFGHPAHARHV
jgi:NAD(P) transhydrogenase subunit alpha